MKAKFIHPGETIDIQNTGAAVIPFGSVVNLTTRVGVAATDIRPGEAGAVHTVGVWSMAKAAGAVAQGAAVYYDTDADAVTTTAADNIPAGWATMAAGADDATVAVKLLG